MTKRFAITCAIAIVLAIAPYIYAFAFHFNHTISSSPSDWGALGDYIGGIVNPLLSFASIILIIRTVQLQRDANDALKEDLETAKQESKLRAFDAKLSSLISVQHEQLKSFKLEFSSVNGEHYELEGVTAILELEDLISSILDNGIAPNLELLLRHLDSRDSLLTAIRRFYIPLRMISIDLSDLNGFSRKTREENIETLIGFTDFSLLRLIMLSAEHIKSSPAEYITNNVELKSVLASLEFSRWPAVP